MSVARWPAAARRQHEVWAAGRLPAVEHVASDIWSIPVPMPHPFLRYVLVYALVAEGRVLLIDAGWDSADAWDALEGGLRSIGFGCSDVAGVLVTHGHRDHAGLTRRIHEQCGSWVAMSPADDAMSRALRDDAGGWLSRSLELMSQCGVPERISVAWRQEWEASRLGSADFHVTDLVRDQEVVEFGAHRLRAIATPGHSPGHLCYAHESLGVVFTGDHVLPHITPNVSVSASFESDPLGRYLRSLERVRGLDIGLVLPAHEFRFVNLAERVDEVVAHHHERLDEIRAALERNEDTSVDGVAARLGWSRPFADLPPLSRRAAVAETHAHLVHLEAAGEVTAAYGACPQWRLTAGA